MGSAELQFFQWQDEEASVNDRSAVTHVEYGERTMLFLADLETDGLHALMEQAPSGFLKTEIIKHPHHGLTLLPDEYLELSGVRMSIITNGKRVTTTINQMHHSGVNPVLTELGYVHLATDGQLWFAEQLTNLTQVSQTFHGAMTEKESWTVEEEDQ